MSLIPVELQSPFLPGPLSSVSGSNVQDLYYVDTSFASLDMNKLSEAEAGDVSVYGYNIMAPDLEAGSCREPNLDSRVIEAVLQLDMELQMHNDFDRDDGPTCSLLPQGALDDMWVVPGLFHPDAATPLAAHCTHKHIPDDTSFSPPIDVDEHPYDEHPYDIDRCPPEKKLVCSVNDVADTGDVRVSGYDILSNDETVPECFQACVSEPSRNLQMEVDSADYNAQLECVPLELATGGDKTQINSGKGDQILEGQLKSKSSIFTDDNCESPCHSFRASQHSRLRKAPISYPPRDRKGSSAKVRRSTRRIVRRSESLLLSSRRSHRSAYLETPKKRKRVTEKQNSPSLYKSGGVAGLHIRKPDRVEKRLRPRWGCGVDGCWHVFTGEAASRRHMLTHFDLHLVCFGCNRTFGMKVTAFRRHVEEAYQKDSTGACVLKNLWLGKAGLESGLESEKGRCNNTDPFLGDGLVEKATLMEKGPRFKGGARLVRIMWM